MGSRTHGHRASGIDTVTAGGGPIRSKRPTTESDVNHMMSLKRTIGGLAVAALLATGGAMIPVTAANANSGQDDAISRTNKLRKDAGVEKLPELKSLSKMAQKFAESKLKESKIDPSNLPESCVDFEAGLYDFKIAYGYKGGLSKSTAAKKMVDYFWGKKELRKILKSDEWTHIGAGFYWDGKHDLPYTAVVVADCENATPA